MAKGRGTKSFRAGWVIVLLLGGCADTASQPPAEAADKPADTVPADRVARLEREIVVLRSDYERAIDRLNQIDGEVRSLAPPPAAEAPPGKPAPLATEPPADGKFGIHLATYQKKDSVEEGWSDYRKEYRGVLDGLEPRIASIDLHDGRGTLYRLKAGPFASEADAQSACKKVRAYPAGYCRVTDFAGVPGASFWGKAG
jgi:hypothetical protein